MIRRNRFMRINTILSSILVLFLVMASTGYASELPTYSELQKVLKDVVKEKNGGFGLNMWATIVDRDGVVKAVVFSGRERGDQWPGSRVISAQKANTAVQPG